MAMPVETIINKFDTQRRLANLIEVDQHDRAMEKTGRYTQHPYSKHYSSGTKRHILNLRRVFQWTRQVAIVMGYDNLSSITVIPGKPVPKARPRR